MPEKPEKPQRNNFGCGCACILFAVSIFLFTANWFNSSYGIETGKFAKYVFMACTTLGIIMVWLDIDTNRTIKKKYQFQLDKWKRRTSMTKERFQECFPFVTEDHFSSLDKAAQDLFDFVDKLSAEKAFVKMVSDHSTLDKQKKRVSYKEIFRLFMAKDVARCYCEVGCELGFKGSEGVGLLLVLNRCLGERKLDYYDIRTTYGPVESQLMLDADDMLGRFMGMEVDAGGSDFNMSVFLHEYDEERQRSYLLLLYRFMSLVVKSDGKVDDIEQQWLQQLFKRCSRDTKGKARTAGDSDPYKELQSLIGLEGVKKDIISLSNFIRLSNSRKKKGLKTPNISYHCVFTGNPGTGKTTVARLLAGIFKDLGVVSQGQLIETDRSGLVGEYVGQTAVKTNKIIDKAIDGVLFIDEAYSLAGGGQEDYGKEAIATLLKRMEDDRDRLVVILAGYSDEMEGFIDTNPGLRSRFNRYIHFDDYSVDELHEIFLLNARKNDYKLDVEADAFLLEGLTAVVENKAKDFGNARYVRNLFEKSIEAQANRLSREQALTTEKLTTLETQDIMSAFSETK